MSTRMITRLESGIGPANHAKFITFQFGNDDEGERFMLDEAVSFVLGYVSRVCDASAGFFSDTDIPFCHLGTDLKPTQIRKELSDIIDHMNIRLGAAYNAVLAVACNGEDDFISFGSFDGENVLILEFGGNRDMFLRSRSTAPYGALKFCNTGMRMCVEGDNAYLLKGAGFQSSYKISVPKRKRNKEMSVYLVFLTLSTDPNNSRKRQKK